MSLFILTVLSHTPLWVWAILALLLALGLRFLKPRVLSRRQLWLAPIGLGVYSFVGTAQTFGLQAAPLLGWLLGAALGLSLARCRPSGVQALPDGRVRLAGSALPLTLYLLIFCLRYALGVTGTMAPALLQLAQVALPAALVLGGSAGLLLARAVQAPQAPARDTATLALHAA